MISSTKAPRPASLTDALIMMLLDCPYCGRRDETEFVYGGEAHIARPSLGASDKLWTSYLYFRENRKGVHAERWRHARGCGQWFNALRDTSTHRVWAVYPATESPPSLPQNESR